MKSEGYNIYQAVIGVDKQTKRQNRYGFLQFFDAAEAKRCAEGINNTTINGTTIRVILLRILSNNNYTINRYLFHINNLTILQGVIGPSGF